ncbi:phenylalanine--tRNA ligase subunit beta [Alcanivorax sp. HI0033]|uniref:phenylalanine--tRNA ligase subunit beta n=2 Tax=Alcanivorax TaxID=59753 RepID=UPI0007BA7C30|nr:MULTISPECIES: phenylalanine--tRNA ligase subunit beta [unclassified Alcanivorax]KZX79583.1 phenylalanine--tRNA ligase subunit beta [Alcanivorax sp. HI0011]KZX90481.1 phenylalanine--tRNA ligase subunit beta [Alcanivorax sp. HI0013]KZY12236.1 phenylalanine--tRNA ligase subunit beta [Alcanivorax sp. HI0035]KZX71841.1 phenylalanine--tRNA ligase subunit beta [Alcanivorax sp. HI0007]KZY11667.1 phenylalanine--tRNA ligase subunit beta [Alcanivorax sp. HI0033]
MRFNEAWLREWVNPAIDTDTLVKQLTMAGLEVDAVEPAAPAFTGVVVGQVESCEPHPDADKLSVCQVTNGTDTVQVVCGASNVRTGLKIPFAQVGAVLPGDFKIKKAKLRGQESNGMLCGASELGLEDLIDGLMELPEDAPVGTDVRDYLQLNDAVIEVDLTPNRADCLSVRGIAREVGVMNQSPLANMNIDKVAPAIDDTLSVTLADSEGCPRYLGRVIKGVNVNADSPLWLIERLRRAGLRTIDPIVDVTNYVLLELGQPLHAFDLSKLNGGITVRKAKAEEALLTLDDQELTLRDDTLVIADDSDALALAGVMGGKPSSVTSDTRDIFLECAFFAPLAIAGKARSYGLHTDSSHRFERGVDPQLQNEAIERATALILEIAGGQPGPVSEAVDESKLPRQAEITLRADRIEGLLGMGLPAEQVEDILSRLGMEVSTQESGKEWMVLAPSWRFDMAIEADLIEELARIYGYEKLPSRVPAGSPSGEPMAEQTVNQRRLGDALIDRGYLEAITYTFVEPGLLKQVEPRVEPLPLLNPISTDLGVMRTTLLAGLFSTARHNLNRQADRLRLFETGLRFVPTEQGLEQTPMIAGLLYGSAQPQNWEGKRPVDFFDLKGDVEALLTLSDADAFRFEPGEHPALHPGQTAALKRDGEVVGYLGRIHPRLAADLDLPTQLYAFELALAPLQQGVLPAFAGVSDQPRMRRDLAFVVEDNVPAGELVAAVRNACDERLTGVRIFDIYQGDSIGENRKSLALGLTFQDRSRTLKDEEVNDLVDAVVSQLKQQFNAALRD